MRRIVAGLIIGLASTFARSSAAQTSGGSVEGFARVSGTNEPMPFSLVRIRPSDNESVPSQQTITNAEGHFRLTNVPAGSFRLEVLRIGFRPSMSPPLSLARGQSLRQDLYSEALVISLPAVAVRAGCFGMTELAEDSELAVLWNEARKGVEIRRAFELRYRFTRSFRQESKIHRRIWPDRQQVRADTIVSDPDSVSVRAARVRAARATAGYGSGNRLIVPDEKELLDETFLGTHCLETTLRRTSDGTGVDFRPVSLEPPGYAIRGTIWLDPTTYVVKKIDYQHLENGNAFSQISIRYTPVSVGGSTLQLPTEGDAMLRPRGPGNWRASEVTARLFFNYWRFEEYR